MKIKIITSSLTTECEQCGGNYSVGAKIFIDDELVLDKPAEYGCYDTMYFDDNMALQWVLEDYLGHKIEWEYEEIES